MKKNINLLIILQLIFIISSCSDDNITVKSDKDEYPNFGLYGFFLGQTVEEACENAIKRDCNMVIESPCININGIPKNLDNKLLTFKNRSMFLSTTIIGPRVPNKYLNFDINKFKAPEVKNEYMEKIFGNMMKNFDDVKNKDLLKFMVGKLDIEMPQKFNIRMSYLIEDFNTLKAKIYLIAFTQIDKDIYHELISTVESRYGNGKKYTYTTDANYKVDALVWSKNNSYGLYSFSTKPKEKDIIYLGFYSPEAKYNLNSYYRKLIDSYINKIGDI